MDSDEAMTGGLPPPLTGQTRLFAIIGDPIVQAGSPRVFNTLFRERGIGAVLVPLHVGAADLAATIDGLRRIRNLDGLIVTVPHKTTAAALVDDLGPQAARVGAVNAIRRAPEGRLVGENFDGLGCVIGLERAGHAVVGRRVLLVGAGGAGCAVAHALADAGIAALRLFDVDAAKAKRLAQAIGRARPELDVEVGAPDPRGFTLVVNCTPLGSAAEDPFPVAPDHLDAGTLVVDVLLKPRISPLLEAAAQRGCVIQPGHRMLEDQAEAIADFFGIEP